MALILDPLYHAKRRRREAQDLHGYSALIANPADLGTALPGQSLDPLSLPANGRFSLSYSAALTLGDLSVLYSQTGGDLAVPAAGADERQYLGWLEKDGQITVQVGLSTLPGTVTLYVVSEWFQPFVIATGVIL